LRRFGTFARINRLINHCLFEIYLVSLIRLILIQEGLHDLTDLWHKEYQILRGAIDALNAKELSITAELNYKGGKKAFKDYVSSILKGSGVTNKNLESLVSSYNDCIELYFDLKETQGKLKEMLSSSNQYQKFSEYINDNSSTGEIFR